MALLLAVGQIRARRRRTVNIWRDPLEQLSNSELIDRYRLDRQSIQELSHEIEPYLTVSNYRGRSLPLSLQVLITLRYLATGDMQRSVGDTVNVAQSTVSRTISSVTKAISRISSSHISMPSTDLQQKPIMGDFFQRYQIPGVIGLIDGTHIRVQSPSENEVAYVNRKNFHSINVQAIVDNRNLIRDVVAK